MFGESLTKIIKTESNRWYHTIYIGNCFEDIPWSKTIGLTEINTYLLPVNTIALTFVGINCQMIAINYD